MMKKILSLTLLLTITACSNLPSSNTAQKNPVVSQVVEIKDLNEIEATAQDHKDTETLLVLDIDDTLLTANEFFGSDKWYDWQRGRATDPSGQEIALQASQKVACLFDVLGMAYEMAPNQLTQSDGVEVVDGIGLDQLVLTARSETYRAATMRELKRNGFEFADNHLAPGGEPVRFLGEADDRTADVSYVDGVFMVAGLDKGVMLRDLLAKLDRTYQTVIFVDDKEKNITNMKAAMEDAGINFYGFHYLGVDKAISPQEVTQGVDAAKDLTAFLEEHFPGRADMITEEQCAY